jgi:hypothetical protein
LPETALPFSFEEARSNTSRQLPPGNNRTDGLSWEGVLLSLQRFNSLCTTAACEQFYSYRSVETTAADYRPRDRITGYFHRSGPQARIPHSQVVSAGKCSYISVDGESYAIRCIFLSSGDRAPSPGLNQGSPCRRYDGKNSLENLLFALISLILIDDPLPVWGFVGRNISTERTMSRWLIGGMKNGGGQSWFKSLFGDVWRMFFHIHRLFYDENRQKAPHFSGGDECCPPIIFLRH